MLADLSEPVHALQLQVLNTKRVIEAGEPVSLNGSCSSCDWSYGPTGSETQIRGEFERDHAGKPIYLYGEWRS